MITQKQLDLEVADRLENFANNLSHSADISQGRMDYIEYCNLLSALRYAVAMLRSEGNKNE